MRNVKKHDAPLSRSDRLRIAAEANRDPRSVDAVLNGRSKGIVEESIRAAAQRLGIRLPKRAA
jgi:hypothetical protein